MTRPDSNQAHRAAALAILAPLALLAACGGDENTPTPVATPPVPDDAATLDVAQCLAQPVFADGTTVGDLVVPDVLTIDPSLPPGFPNGRTTADPVADITLAAIFLDLDAPGQDALTFHRLPLNPPQNDIGPVPTTFPFVLGPQGNPPIASNAGSGFAFRTDAPEAYTRVERFAFPALSTVLVPSDLQVRYNDASPADDVAGEFVLPIAGVLTDLTLALQDDLAGFDLCAD